MTSVVATTRLWPGGEYGLALAPGRLLTSACFNLVVEQRRAMNMTEENQLRIERHAPPRRRHNGNEEQ